MIPSRQRPLSVLARAVGLVAALATAHTSLAEEIAKRVSREIQAGR
jgi:hypothetical protein